MRILIVEDNKVLSNNIAAYLKLENIEIKQLFTGENVNYELVSNNYDLVILDLGLPDVDGVELCTKIRESGKNISILMLTARNTIKDKILDKVDTILMKVESNENKKITQTIH